MISIILPAALARSRITHSNQWVSEKRAGTGRPDVQTADIIGGHNAQRFLHFIWNEEEFMPLPLAPIAGIALRYGAVAVAGYVLGTYAAILCMHVMKWVSGA